MFENIDAYDFLGWKKLDAENIRCLYFPILCVVFVEVGNGCCCRLVGLGTFCIMPDWNGHVDNMAEPISCISLLERTN